MDFLINSNESIAYFESTYATIYENGKFEEGPLKIEKYELGKNIDLKFKDFIIGKSNFGIPVGDFYCFPQIMDIYLYFVILM